jgi:tRNA(Leu) C34 or U34 (ribose-2'-O)-methylase TrmL
MTGICLYSPTIEENFGSILRLAHNFNVDFVCTIKKRYKRQKPDKTNATFNIPTFHFEDVNSFLLSCPENCVRIALEITDKSLDLETFSHPKHAVYIFGGEKPINRIPESLLNKCHATLKIKTNQCLNLAMCAGITLFHRNLTLKS